MLIDVDTDKRYMDVNKRKTSSLSMDFRLCMCGLFILVVLLSDVAECRRKSGPSVDETFFLPHSLKQKYKHRILTHKHRIEDLITPWTDLSETTAKPTPIPAAIAACPWTYNIVYNPQRIPDTTLEAVCSTDQCLDPRVANHTRHVVPPITRVEQHQSAYVHKLPHSTVCREVKYYRWVKVKTPRRIQGQWKLTRMLLPVTVACTCISISSIPS